jgi:alcohol dehydrogenase class IV
MVLAFEHLHAATSSPTPSTRRAMSKAAHLAGRAINVTKTTAAHALSYPLTMEYDVPHGQAVCLTLPGLLAFNAATSDADVVDPRGAAHVVQVTGDIVRLLGCRLPQEAQTRIKALIRSIGLASSLEGLGIPHEQAVRHAVDGVNVQRLGNNPRRLSEEDLRALFETD